MPDMSLVQNVDSAGATIDANSTSATITTTTGNTLIAIVSMNAFLGAVSVNHMSDTASNTWTNAAIVSSAVGGNDDIALEIWYSQNAASVTSVTATLNAGTYPTGWATTIGLSVLEVAGVSGTPAGATAASGTGSTFTLPMNKSGMDGSQVLIAAAMGCDTTVATLALDTGSTLTGFAPITILYNSGSNHDAAVQYTYAFGTATTATLTGTWDEGAATKNHVAAGLVLFPSQLPIIAGTVW